jgi:hypothetical protein
MSALDWYVAASASFGTPAAIIFATHYAVEVMGRTSRLITPAWILAGACWIAGMLVAIGS